MLRGNRVLAFLVVLLAGAALRLPAQAAPTPAETEGPFYKTGSPERDTLYGPSDPGWKIILTGKVLDSRGRPIANAWVDFWQADARGRYDNVGFAYRGHVFTDPSGAYTVRTVVPGDYPGRTPHIHVKVRAGYGPVLTTQLYFPESSARNERDAIYDPRLLVRWDADGSTARFDFVLP